MTPAIDRTILWITARPSVASRAFRAVCASGSPVGGGRRLCPPRSRRQPAARAGVEDDGEVDDFLQEGPGDGRQVASGGDAHRRD
jgi:hypothetical protein